jgi:hypothetical protein
VLTPAAPLTPGQYAFSPGGVMDAGGHGAFGIVEQ